MTATGSAPSSLTPSSPPDLPPWVGPLFARLAVPRLPGTAALRTLETEVGRQLERLGYVVARTAFTATPARLTGGAVAGMGLGWAALLLAPLLVSRLAGWTVTLSGFGLLGLVALAAYGVANGYVPAARTGVEAANLEARRGTPRVWLVAHLDSKGQRFSLLVRALATASAVAALAGLVVLLLLRLEGPLPWLPVALVLAAALAGGAVLATGGVDDTSPGAVDNASGVIAVLTAAEALRGAEWVGVLLTSAEEFGMVGARLWVARPGPRGAFVNFDGIDSRGRFRVMPHRGDHAATSSLAAAVADALRESGTDAAIGRLPLGVWVDGTVLSAARMPGVTVSRGDWATLGVIHTRADTPARVDVRAAVDAGRAVAAAVLRVFG